jgi:Flp pilus assembly protein TadG
MRDPRRGERGVTAVLVAVLMAMLLGFVALAMNLGHRTAVRGQLQNAADAAALAGAKELDGTLAKITSQSPELMAANFSARHQSDRLDVTIDPTVDVTLGNWDPYATNLATAFTPITAATAADARNVNAVQVTTFRQASRGNTVAVWMDAFLGNTNKGMDVVTQAVAVNGGPCIDDCPDVPLAFFTCGLVQSNDALNCWTYPHMTYTATFSPDPSDTVGFSSLSSASASTTVYRDILGGNNCANYLTHVGESVNVSNGAQLNALCGTDNPPGFNKFCLADNNGDCTIHPKIHAPVVDGDCPPKFNQAHTVVGFATLIMTKLSCKGATKYMEFQFLCDQIAPNPDKIGCGFWGTGPLQPKLVR